MLVTVASLSGVAAAKYLLGQLTSNIEITSSVLSGDTGKAKDAASAGKLPTGAIDLLLLGLDTRAGWDKSGLLSRPDTIIILHISASHDQAYMISIPRDTVVQIPADPTLGFNGDTAKINAAYAYGSAKHGWPGGARLQTAAVHKLTGLTFDGVVQIDLAGFTKVVEAMGGVNMCVEKDTWSSHYTVGPDGKQVYNKGREGDHKIPNNWIHKAGCRDMAGWEALDYSRQRYGLPNSDYDRQRHQQQLLRAMAKKATSAGVLTDPGKLTKLVQAAGGSLKMDTHGVPLADFIYGLKSIAGADLIALKTNSGTYAPSSLGDGEGINDATRQLFQAAKDDKLSQFVMDNLEYLIPDSNGSPAG